MSIDGSTHSLFGVSKAAADLLVQEYGRYFDMPTVCFRGGCLTGPNHAGTQLHGFLSYLMRCTITGQPYTVFGYGGKQVRDNIHSADLVAAFEAFAQGAARGGGLQPRRRARVQLLDARGDPHVRGDRGPQARLDLLRARTASATTAGGSPTSPRSSATTPSGRCATRSRTSCARSTTRTWSTGPRREPLGRHPGAQRGGGRRADAARADRPARAGGDRLRDRRRRRRLLRRDGRRGGGA